MGDRERIKRINQRLGHVAPDPQPDTSGCSFIYARDLDGTGSMRMCSKEDEGAVRYIRLKEAQK